MMDAFELSAEAAFRGLVYDAKGSTQFALGHSLSTRHINLAGRIVADTRVISLTTSPGDAGGAGLRIAP